MADPLVRAYLQKQIDEEVDPYRVNETARLGKAWTIFPRDFNVADGTMTPTFKMRRLGVTELYQDEIDKMYEDLIADRAK
ncbi:MAG: hypothetical protein IIA35_07090 [Proteobacteria bacterium]|nr:hypothetical protein [Pseudomonadota bacterium]